MTYISAVCRLAEAHFWKGKIGKWKKQREKNRRLKQSKGGKDPCEGRDRDVLNNRVM